MLEPRGALYPPELCPPNTAEDLPAGVAANAGAECTCANPFFETCWFKWLMLLREPRGIPIPAEPAFTVIRGDANEDVVATRPIITVLVPAVGATRGFTRTSVVGLKMGAPR